MADLSKQLSDVNDSAASRVIEAPGQASGLATALGSLAKGFDSIGEVFSKRTQMKRQAAADARAAEDQQMQREKFNHEKQGWAADSFAANGMNTLNAAANGDLPTGGTVLTDQAGPAFSSDLGGLQASDEAFVDKASGQISRYQQGVNQGRLPPIALNGLANKLFNEGLNRGLDAGQLAKAFKDRGIDAFHAYESQMDDQKAIEKARQEERANAYKQGLVADPTAQEVGKTEDEIVALGRQKINQDALLDVAEKNARMQQAANADQRATNTDIREQDDRMATNFGTLRFDSAIEGVMGNVLRYTNPSAAPERGSDTGYEMQRAKIEAGLPQYFQQVKAQVLNSMRANNYSPSAISQAESAIDNRIKGTLDGLQAGGQSYRQAAQLVTTSFGLTMKETAPLLYQMKQLGIDYTAMPGVLDAIDPKTKAAVGAQMKSILSDGIVDSVEKATLKNIIAVASGKANITDIDSKAGQQKIIGTATNYVVNNNRQIASGKGDPEVWMSFGRQVTIGAASLTPQTSAPSLLKATEVLAGSGTIDAVNKLRSTSEHAEEATILGSAKRSASARLLQSAQTRLRSVLQSGTDKYQILQYDENKGQWGFVFNDKLWRQSHPGGTNPSFIPGAPSYAQGQQANSVKAPPSKEAQQLLATMNGNLSFLTRTGEWDNDAPKGTFKEVAAFWATNKPTADMQKKAVAAKKSGSITDIGNSILEGFSNIPSIDTTPDNSDIIGPEGTGKNPRSSAQGVGQFTNDTWISTMKKHAPELIQGKSEADILSMRNNKELARKAVGWYRGDNAAYLASRGLPSGRTATALAHFAGPEGAAALFRADPNAPVSSALSQAAINANPHLRGLTVAQTIDWANKFYRG